MILRYGFVSAACSNIPPEQVPEHHNQRGRFSEHDEAAGGSARLAPRSVPRPLRVRSGSSGAPPTPGFSLIRDSRPDISRAPSRPRRQAYRRAHPDRFASAFRVLS